MGSIDQQTEAAGGTVGKALHVLDMVADKGRPVRFNDVLADSPFPKATLYRLFQTLTSQGLLSYDEERQTYAPGMRLVRLAHAAWRQSSLAPVARPFLDALSRKVGETIHLAQFDNGQVLYVDKRNAASPVEMFSQAGKIGPSYCTGVGKAMLAFLKPAELDQAIRNQSFYKHTEHTLTNEEALRAELQVIREEGVSYDREEHEPGIICIAAPILASNKRVIGALSITTTTREYAPDGLDELRPVLLSTAHEIAQAAESWQFPSA